METKHHMTKNMGGADRMIRVIIALIICILYLNNTINGTEGGLLLLLAVYLAFNSLTGVCPVYSAFGFNTTGKEIQED